MANYPNRDALRDAHDIYLDAIRQFISKWLEEVQSQTRDLEIRDVAHLIRKYWSDVFQKQFRITNRDYDTQSADRYYDARSVTMLIVAGRNRAAHPPWDLDSEYTRTHLFLIAEVLGEINEPDAKRAVEEILGQLLTDDAGEHLTSLQAMNTAYKKRLTTMSNQLAVTVAGKATAEERLTDISNLLKSVEAENADLKKRLLEKENPLKTVGSESGERIKTLSEQLIDNATKLDAKEETLSTSSDQLRTVEAEKTGLEEHLKNLLKQPKTLNTLEDRVEIGRKVAELRINSAGSKPMSWARIRAKLGLKNNEFHKVIRLEDHFHKSVVERIESFDNGWEYGGKLEVLLGFEPVGELANRIEACKPAPKEEVKSEEAKAEETPEETPEPQVEQPEEPKAGSDSESPAKSPKPQRKWRRPGAIASLIYSKVKK